MGPTTIPTLHSEDTLALPLSVALPSLLLQLTVGLRDKCRHPRDHWTSASGCLSWIETGLVLMAFSSICNILGESPHHYQPFRPEKMNNQILQLSKHRGSPWVSSKLLNFVSSEVGAGGEDIFFFTLSTQLPSSRLLSWDPGQPFPSEAGYSKPYNPEGRLKIIITHFILNTANSG